MEAIPNSRSNDCNETTNLLVYINPLASGVSVAGNGSHTEILKNWLGCVTLPSLISWTSNKVGNGEIGLYEGTRRVGARLCLDERYHQFKWYLAGWEKYGRDTIPFDLSHCNGDRLSRIQWNYGMEQRYELDFADSGGGAMVGRSCNYCMSYTREVGAYEVIPIRDRTYYCIQCERSMVGIVRGRIC